MRLKSALRRGVAAAVIAGIVVSSGIPAYAARWNIADGDITVEGASDESGNYNKVKQGDKDFKKDEGETVITGKSKEHTVTIDTSGGKVDVTFDDLKIDVSGKKEGDGSDDSPVDAGKAAVTVKGDHDAAIELDGDNKLKSGSGNAGLEKNKHESEGTLTIKDDNGKDGSLTAEGGDDGAGIGGGIGSTGSSITIRGGTIEAVGGAGAAGIGDGVGAQQPEIDQDTPPSNPNNIIICGDAEVTAKAGSQKTDAKAPAIGGTYGEVPTENLSDDEHKVTGGRLTRLNADGTEMEGMGYDYTSTPTPQPEEDEDDDDDDENDAPNTQAGEVPDRVKQMYETVGVITHPDGTQELGNVATAEYDPVNKVLSFDAHGTLFRMTGDSLRELAKEVHELRIRFLDGEGREMEAVIPLARIKDLVGVNGAFELELSHEGRYQFRVVGQTGYDRKTFSDETVLRQSGKELILVYRVGDEEQKAQETARVEEAIARRKQEKKQWGTVLSGLEGGSLSGLPELTQPGTGTVGDLSGLTTLSPDSLTTAQQPETSGQPSETSAQQPEARGWVKDSQGDWVWKPGKDDSQPPDLRGDWETRKWVRVSQSPDLAWWNSFYDSVREYDYEG